MHHFTHAPMHTSFPVLLNFYIQQEMYQWQKAIVGEKMEHNLVENKAWKRLFDNKHVEVHMDSIPRHFVFRLPNSDPVYIQTTRVHESILSSA